MHIFWITVLVLFLSSCSGEEAVEQSSLQSAELRFQNDADLIRLEHLVYWTGLLEEYESQVGHFPFQNELITSEDIGLVKIASKQQLSYLSRGGDLYRANLDVNANGRLREKSIAELVSELESTLGRPIEGRYDIQKIPAASPIGYNYYYTGTGYLFWVTCITCGVTEISTLLMDGFTPTVNIASAKMKNQVPKALLRSEMISHPIFESWMAKDFLLEEHARSVVAELLHEPVSP